MKTSSRGFRLVPMAFAAWTAGLVSVLLPWVAVPLAVIAVSVLVLTVVASWRRGTLPVWVLAPLAVGIVAAHVGVLGPGRVEATDAAVGHHVTIEVEITSKVEPALAGAWRFTGEARGVVGSAASTNAVRAPVTVLFSGERADGVDLGATVAVAGTAMPGRAWERAVVIIRAAKPPTVTRAPPGVFGVAADLRQAFLDASLAFPDTGAHLLPGLAVGDTTAVDDELDAQMKVSSLSHLTAVSGANCAIVVGVVFGILAWCRAPRWARVAGSLIGLAGFVVLVTPEPSVVRAAAMASLAMLAVLLGRARSGLGVLCAAVVVLVSTDPWLATSIGFVLSVAATAALILLAEPIARRLEPWVPRPVALALAVPIAAQIVCAPILILLTPAVSVYGVIANVLCAPAATLATVLGLLACLTTSVPGAGFVLTALAWVPSQWVATTARIAAGLPQARLPWPDGFAGFALLAVVSAAVIVLIVVVRHGLWRSSAAVIVTLVVAIACGSWGVRTIARPLLLPQDWSIAACDVGQGDAVLVRSGESVALIDTGPDPLALGSCLQTLGIGRLSLVVLTHFDADHAGGLDAVLGRADMILHGPPAPEHAGIMRALAADGAREMQATAGMSGTLGEATWTLLWPPPMPPPGNDASLILEIAGGGVPRSIFLGDLGAEAQQRLLASRAIDGPYTVVKVAHHGSADQSERLYAALGASLALVTVGAGNDYGHPRADTLAMLDRLGMTIARTDAEGLLLVGLDERGLTLWRERSISAPESTVPP